MLFLLFSFLLPTPSALANSSASDLEHLPKSFKIHPADSVDAPAVFCDFDTATYDITYDQNTSTAQVKAAIDLVTYETGYPIFDSVVDPTHVSIDGEAVASTAVRTPSNETTVRVIQKQVAAGTHHLEIDLPLKELLSFDQDGVKSAFWMTDLKDRGYLERYLPTNFIFDRMKITLHLHFIGNTHEQAIYANGVVTKESDTQNQTQNYTVEYPETYTPISIFFHTTPAKDVAEIRFSFHSIDGRTVPAVLYVADQLNTDNTARLQALRDSALSIISNLESDFGALPHPSLTIYIAGSGGMEYSGATMSSPTALNHELFHSYFARGVMPADGNAGWIDEALAVWRDTHFPSHATLSGTSIMASHPYYTRATDPDAYSFGAAFMGYLHQKFAAQGGLKPFLRYMVQTHLFTPYSTADFSKEMGLFYHTSVEADFQHYAYGMNRTDYPGKSLHLGNENEFHPQFTFQELKQLL